MASEESWKQQYLQELESAKAREESWKAERHTLERLLVRTSFASEGQDRALDELLSRLRDQLRTGTAGAGQIKSLQDALDRRIAELDGLKGQADQQLKTSLDRLISVVLQHSLFVPQKSALRALAKSLASPDTRREGLPSWLDQLAELEALALSQNPAQQKPQGAFGRLFGRDKTPDAQTLQESGLSPEYVLSPEAPDDSGVVDHRANLARKVSELLEQMLTQVTLDSAARARAEGIRTLLEQRTDWDGLRDALNEVSELVVSAVSREQREFEAFLKRLDERLLALQSHLHEQAEVSASRQSASESLELDLNRDLQALSQNLDQAQDVTELKHSVNAHLESIGRTLKQFRESESQREQSAHQQMEVMREKLAAMEAQSEHTHEQLKRERARALTDVLTQLPNREAWQERLRFEHVRWQRYGHPVVLCVLDIDLFKRVNDSFGHKAGDRVIQLIAKALRDRLRTTDFVARYGGEEFVALLPETEVTAAGHVMDALRAHVSSLPFHFQGQPVAITFSAGLAPFREGLDMDAVFDQADRALYRAKEAGRNRIEVAG
ncbi:GGDEF domain-containing protein [Marinobacter salicampi]|uniref:GGDEF domain-containing protein n=1 Tax=Marinobacter salicampi TaxID=435907 RepID=UPI001408E6C8|nr:GGDEF domain-containing protein [Marinobacter salicampi]